MALRVFALWRRKNKGTSTARGVGQGTALREGSRTGAGCGQEGVSANKARGCPVANTLFARCDKARRGGRCTKRDWLLRRNMGGKEGQTGRMWLAAQKHTMHDGRREMGLARVRGVRCTQDYDRIPGRRRTSHGPANTSICESRSKKKQRMQAENRVRPRIPGTDDAGHLRSRPSLDL
ncbi:hypothetical protein ANO11243_040990 [Dothideomycetidae sp. 11243]|nr:hypothetical protein ANO11243_040990 [fungal sp. No.11243]